jgi:heat shock protein HslJ
MEIIMKKSWIVLIGIVVIGLGLLVLGLNANNIVRQDSSIDLPQSLWILTTYNGQEPIASHQPTLQFKLGQVSGTTGCNHYSGTYHVEGDSIRFEGIFSTEMACLEPEGLMDQERIYLELLQTVDQYELEADRLRFFAESNPALIFEIHSDEPVLTRPTNAPSDPVSSDSPHPQPFIQKKIYQKIKLGVHPFGATGAH